MRVEDNAISCRDPRVGSVALSYGLLRECAELGRRKVQAIVERARMARIRHRPQALLRALCRASSVLVVCHGNIIRSPFAAGVLRSLLGPDPRVTIRSAGVEAVAGRPPHPIAQRVAAALQIDLSGHASAPLTQELVAASDVILAADVLQIVSIRRRFPDASSKTFLLASLSPSVPLEISDPIEGDEPLFIASYRHIVTAVFPIALVLCGRGVRR